MTSTGTILSSPGMEEQENDQSDWGDWEAESSIAVAEAPPTDAELATMLPARFSVHDEQTADWLVRKLVEADAHIRRVKEQAAREIRRTERERDFLRMRFGKELESWARTQLAQHKGRRKSLLLLSGTVGFRAIAAKLIVADASKLLGWSKRHCKSAIVVVERVSKTAINAHFASTGEVPAGTQVQGATQRFYVK